MQDSPVAILLRGAADLVGRSPYPLVEAAERLDIDYSSSVFKYARAARDAHRPRSRKNEQHALLDAAAAIERGWSP